MDKLAMSIPNAAEACDVSPNHIKRLIREGGLPCVRFGGRVLIPTRGLQEYIERASRREQDPEAQAAPAA